MVRVKIVSSNEVKTSVHSSMEFAVRLANFQIKQDNVESVIITDYITRDVVKTFSKDN